MYVHWYFAWSLDIFFSPYISKFATFIMRFIMGFYSKYYIFNKVNFDFLKKMITTFTYTSDNTRVIQITVLVACWRKKFSN